MGCMECNRRRCDNIMCSRLSLEYGHICNDCFEELVGKGPLVDVLDFMKSNKKPSREDEARARYEIVFPRDD